MQNVVVDKPYVFVPPRPSTFWLRLLLFCLPRYLNKSHGIEMVDIQGIEHLRESIAQKRGIILTPNHSRPCDPMLMGMIIKPSGRYLYLIASWHIFMQGKFQRFMLNRGGGFSIYREGTDRQAINAAVQIVEEGRRPLVIFPEGAISRTNDRLGVLQTGTALIARSAAKKRQAAGLPPTVVHPVAIRYTFHGKFPDTVEPVLTNLETRLSWRPQTDLPLYDRIVKLGQALLSLKEVEYTGQTQPGGIFERIARLIDRILDPLEKEWLAGQREATIIHRVKKLRGAILPDMIEDKVTPQERARRWRQLDDIYLAMQLSWYPADYIASHSNAERIIETLERIEDDLGAKVTVHRPLKATITIGPAIEVEPQRNRGGNGDPLMDQIETQLKTMLGIA